MALFGSKNYASIVAPLKKMVADLNAYVEEQKAKITGLEEQKAKILSQKDQIKSLGKRLERLEKLLGKNNA